MSSYGPLDFNSPRWAVVAETDSGGDISGFEGPIDLTLRRKGVVKTCRLAIPTEV